MSFLNILNIAGEIPEVAYTKFLQQYKFNAKTIHFFFEGGDDQSYYVNFIEAIFPEEYTFYYYICNGKDNVYQNYNDINWATYNKRRALFFTDKDVDDLIGKLYVKDYNVFETEYYSIENYLVNNSVYKRFLKELCLITNESAISQLKLKFESELKRFYSLMAIISAWVIYCRKNNYKINLSDIDMSKIFHIGHDFIINKKKPPGYKTCFDYICSATKTAFFNLEEIKSIASTITSLNPKYFIRGKYELWFMYAFCKATIEVTIPELNAEIKKYNKSNLKKLPKSKITVSITLDNLMQILGPRTKIPPKLNLFLTENFQALT